MAYSIINAILVKNKVDICASEAHGMATGLLCADGEIASHRWLDEVLHNASILSDEQKLLLIKLFEGTRQLLIHDEFEFDLFLPDDNTPLAEQIEALKNWCQGFLFGIASLSKELHYSKDALEILRDITEFTKLDNDANDDNEDDINALMELTEYLRAAVLLLRDELSSNTEK